MMYMSTFVSKQRKDKKNNVCIKIMDSLKKKKKAKTLFHRYRERSFVLSNEKDQLSKRYLRS